MVRKEWRGGLSLLEVILSTFLFLTLSVIATGYFSGVSEWVNRTRAKMLGGFVAEQIMEQVRSKEFEEVDSLAGSGVYKMDVTRFGTEVRYTINYNVAIVLLEPELKSAKVEVIYAKDQSFKFETLIVPRY